MHVIFCNILIINVFQIQKQQKPGVTKIHVIFTILSSPWGHIVYISKLCQFFRRIPEYRNFGAGPQIMQITLSMSWPGNRCLQSIDNRHGWKAKLNSQKISPVIRVATTATQNLSRRLAIVLSYIFLLLLVSANHSQGRVKQTQKYGLWANPK